MNNTKEKLHSRYANSSDVTRCAEASKHVSSNEGGVSAKRASRLASFRGGAKNYDVRSLAARLYHVIALGSGSDFATRFYSCIDSSGSIQNVGF